MKYSRHIQKIFRAQERLIRQSNKTWACMVKAETKRRYAAYDKYEKKTIRLINKARKTHSILVALCPEFYWSSP